MTLRELKNMFGEINGPKETSAEKKAVDTLLGQVKEEIKAIAVKHNLSLAVAYQKEYTDEDGDEATAIGYFNRGTAGTTYLLCKKLAKIAADACGFDN